MHRLRTRVQPPVGHQSIGPGVGGLRQGRRHLGDDQAGHRRPKTLTAAQLNAIYSANADACLTWKDVGGTSTDAIVPALPQASLGTRTFFLSTIGVTPPGTCVVNGETDIPGDANNPVLLEENTGTSVGGTTTSARTGNQYFFANNPTPCSRTRPQTGSPSRPRRAAAGTPARVSATAR